MYYCVSVSSEFYKTVKKRVEAFCEKENIVSSGCVRIVKRV